MLLEEKIGNLDERSKNNFLVYANSVIKSRAIPNVEDNLKPIHRKILYTLYEDKVTPDKPTKKCATEAGRALAYSPHGDASVYGAMVRLAQWWKIRYPLIEMQGNCGNILGDGAAASRYTECRLSKIGMLMLDGLNQDCVPFKPNYDNTTTEPVTLPSKFPYLLCGNNSGIAVGLSSDLVSHNFTEVMGAINYYMENKATCTTSDLLKFIKGPDFPTGGKIINGDELLDIYSCGRGAVKVCSHYEVIKNGGKTLLVFHDIPYGVEIDSGVKAPLQKYVIEEGNDDFESINVSKIGPKKFDIVVTLGKGANVSKCLDILFTKTRLADTIKINQTVIVNGEPKLLSLKQLIEHWVDYRSNVIKLVATNEYKKTDHKLTVTLGLQKCLSDIDKLVSLIRNSDSRAAAKFAIMKAFELNEEQADAVLDMKLSKLSKLDITELKDTATELEKTLARLLDVMKNEQTRYKQISEELADIKKVIGSDERLTEIAYRKPSSVIKNGVDESTGLPAIKKEWIVTSTAGVEAASNSQMDGKKISEDVVDSVMAYSPEEVYICGKDGSIGPSGSSIGSTIVRGFNTRSTEYPAANKVVSVTKNGYIKISDLSECKGIGKGKVEKVMKVKEGDELVYVGIAKDDEFLMLFSQSANKVLKLPINSLTVAKKMTIGVKSGFNEITSADIVKNSDLMLSVLSTAGHKGKLTRVADFSVDSRGNVGQTICDNTQFFKLFEQGRENFYAVPKSAGRPFVIGGSKVSIKGKTALGASLTERALEKII